MTSCERAEMSDLVHKTLLTTHGSEVAALAVRAAMTCPAERLRSCTSPWLHWSWCGIGCLDRTSRYLPTRFWSV